ncbi:uncharacterized protein F4822DRAFT_414865 [Hypoxylon trugodes]|uniref:uncharacterized protein n=1 Tax=Hypoxylon trugodes TaxID=326681 RepID=UPI002194CCF9|nr:uncharacterized protein F4822DRAFT_414865 [Hypoxylon trugodes]KAI1384358.1 hypothetical protein F4822DRAFT_414865 [Hypoxylon trugodes]
MSDDPMSMHAHGTRFLNFVFFFFWGMREIIDLFYFLLPIHFPCLGRIFCIVYITRTFF